MITSFCLKIFSDYFKSKHLWHTCFFWPDPDTSSSLWCLAFVFAYCVQFHGVSDTLNSQSCLRASVYAVPQPGMPCSFCSLAFPSFSVLGQVSPSLESVPWGEWKHSPLYRNCLSTSASLSALWRQRQSHLCVPISSWHLINDCRINGYSSLNSQHPARQSTRAISVCIECMLLNGNDCVFTWWCRNRKLYSPQCRGRGGGW